MTRFRLVAVLVGLTTLMSSATAPAGAAKGRKQIRLHAFSSCAGLVSYGTRHMAKVVSPMRGAPMPVTAPPAGAAPGGSDGAAPPMAESAPAAGGGAGQDFSQTNVQEAGVDEPDTVKTDGSTLFVLRGGVLYAIDARAGTPAEIGSVKLANGYGHVMLLHEGRALVVSTEAGAAMPIEGDGVVAQPATSMVANWQPKTVISELDVRDPTSMRVLRTLTVDGSFLSARLNGRTARLVLMSTPQAIAQETSRRAARRLARWLPSSTLRRAGVKQRSRARAVSCRSVRRTSQFSGLDVMTVLTIDLSKGLPAIDADALMTSADTVYASGSSLYVATQRFIRALQPGGTEGAAVPDDMKTAIHRFDISNPDKTVYRSSGEVPGFLLSQWAMSEDRGVLRVASTSQPTWWPGTPVNESESFVTVLDDKGSGALATVGRVGGLGKGERIYAVRFIGDLGYVVTFRQTDPLYVVDVSNPARPRVAGELKILGYSAYLHPAGPDLLIGVGQDATEQGRRLGVQVSLFDVSDPANPRRIQARQLGADSSTETEWDHHPFLWWPEADLAVIPLERYSTSNPFVGAVGLSITRDGIAEAGRLEHPVARDWMGRITRSVVVGDRLFTVSDAGVEASRLAGLADAGWVAFPPSAS